jgi:hypothetical protein
MVITDRYREKQTRPCVEAGSNTSTVSLRVVEGDKKRSLRYEPIKYGHDSHGNQIRE